MSLPMEEETFHHCCQLLLQLSEQLRDGWSWEPVQGSLEGYLKKTVVRSAVIKSDCVWDKTESNSDSGSNTFCEPWSNQQEQCFLEVLCDDDSISTEIADDDEVHTESADSGQMLQYEYHVLFSCSYSTPVLYFRAFTQEGRSLSLEEVWNSVHPNFRKRLQNSPLSTISQEEHPLLGQPFYKIHPCRTEEMMRPVLESALNTSRKVNYVLTWLSVVGPLVGLDVPLKYSILLQSEATAWNTESS